MACAQPQSENETESRISFEDPEADHDQLRSNFDKWSELIIRSLRAGHLFPSSYLFLEESEEEKILGKDESGDYQVATRLLLKIIKDHFIAGDISVMRAFINTLEEKEYSWIADLLLGKRDCHETAQKNQKKIIRVFALRICKVINEADIKELTNQLWSREILTDRHKEEILKKAKLHCTDAATAFLLKWIPTVHVNWYNLFLDTLLRFHPQTSTFRDLVSEIDLDYYAKHIAELDDASADLNSDEGVEEDHCEWNVVCRKCSHPLCRTSNIYKLKGNKNVHYEVKDNNYHNCINLREHPDRESEFDGFVRQNKMYCKQCDHDLGNTVKDSGNTEHYLVKIKGVAFLTRLDDRVTTNQWCKVPLMADVDFNI